MSKGKPPKLGETMVVALGLGLAAAAFFVALVGEPTWPVRIAAISLVALIVILVAVWHWGFRSGSNWPD